MNIKDVNWEKLWQKKNEASEWQEIDDITWDKRAEDFAKQYINQTYIDQIMKKIDFTVNDKVLDIGCGPGTLTIPLAKKVKKVTALDISKKMLEIVSEKAQKFKLKNIDYIHEEFENVRFGEDVQPHDIIICSRAFPDKFPQKNLSLLNDLALKSVYLTVWINGADEYEYFIRRAYANAGYNYSPRPDYIYVLNMLYNLGIQAKIDFVEYQDELFYQDLDDLIEKMFWKSNKKDIQKRKKLKEYLRKTIDYKENIPINLNFYCRWALIHWEKSDCIL